LILVFAFVLAPFVVQAYVSPSNSMAPTILGIHRRGVCSHCGGVAIVPANPSLDLSEEPPQIGICTVCRKTGDVPEVAPDAYGPDRFIVDKLAKPQRWDIVAFRSPEDVQTIYLFRLVGLPGEKLYIKEGKVWINDVAQTLPLEMEGLEYGMGEDEDIELDFGSPDRPLQLGESEYGMLGDFSRRAFDGRFWGPVPEDQLIGVVTLRYWPPSRWTVWQ
jgi:signal peptidase I